jgi:LysM repeat protein
MLIPGFKRETENADNTSAIDTNTPTIDTNTMSLEASNPPVAPTITNPPIVAPISAPMTTEYVVVKGDTLGKIAKAHGVTLKALEAANPNIQPTKLKVGDKLQIPASGSTTESAASMSASTGGSGEAIYTVKSGDTLTKIAKNHGVTIKAIESENGLSGTKIKVGEKLKIPAKAESLPAPAAAPMPAPVAPTAAPAAPVNQ